MAHGFLALAVVFAAAQAQAAPVVIDFTGEVDFFNPGPFTAGTALGGQLTLDDTVVATGPDNTLENVITGFSLTVVEPGGPFVYTNDGVGGRVEQFVGAGGTEFISVGFGGINPGTFNLPVGAPEITSFGIDFRGADLFGDPTILATGLTESDFTFSFTTFRFLDNGVSTLMVERSRNTVSFSGDPQSTEVSAPGIAALFGLGVFGIAAGMRRTRF